VNSSHRRRRTDAGIIEEGERSDRIVNSMDVTVEAVGWDTMID
jgi:hypothetical protein